MKIKKHLAEFLEEFPDPTPSLRPWREGVENRWRNTEIRIFRAGGSALASEPQRSSSSVSFQCAWTGTQISATTRQKTLSPASLLISTSARSLLR
ncbi:hypothetical protein [Methanothrix sp.]|uniref:hypothetical protein n=1 Tax=Methanothrix sp. TaxID=90426 RepID=UPI00257AB2BF|nr:hypothetical protein [Methanothrix sp.]